MMNGNVWNQHILSQIMSDSSTSSNSTNWVYLIEGGKHAIFTYRPNHKTDTVDKLNINNNNNNTGHNDCAMTGYLLRIDKGFFRQCDVVKNESTTTTTTTIIKPNNLNNMNTNCIQIDHDPFRIMIHTILYPYVDMSYMISFDMKFIRSLRDVTIRDNVIPHRRRQDWFVSSNDNIQQHIAIGPCIGYVSKDYRLLHRIVLPQNPVLSKQYDSICIEIKPKGGYTSYSPLIHINHMNKSYQSRYKIVQELYTMGKVQKNWIQRVVDYHLRSMFLLVIMFRCAVHVSIDFWINQMSVIYHPIHHHHIFGVAHHVMNVRKVIVHLTSLHFLVSE